jgi:hypothetical protein
MKLSELSFADHAAVEILPALVRHFSYLGDRPEVEAVRYAYRLADALAIERDTRNAVRDHEREQLRLRVERAETSVSVLLNMGEDFAARVALCEIWEFLGVKNQTAAMQLLRDWKDATERVVR